MLVKRQVVGKEIQFMREQRGKATLFHADHLRCFAFPEVAVMHQERVCLPVNRRGYCRLRGGDGGKDAADFCLAFNLQAVGRVIAETGALQQFVQVGLQLVAGNHDGSEWCDVCQWFCRAGH